MIYDDDEVLCLWAINSIIKVWPYNFKRSSSNSQLKSCDYYRRLY